MSTPREVAAAAATRMRDRYVFPDLGRAGAAHLEDRASAGAYDDLAGAELASALTADLRSVVPDLHLSVRWQAEPRTTVGGSDWDDPDFLAAYWREQDYANQGISKAERLSGNVGLVVVHSLDEPEGAGHVVEAALTFLGRCSALVVDVRVSNGGAPSGVAWWVSHFVDAPARKIVDLVDREGTLVEQTWTTPYVRAPRWTDKPVFVLTGPRTPSAAEELAYDLQVLGRATLVGETTVGAANPVDSFGIDDHHAIRVPTARVVHAVTGGNWEGDGVRPDVECPAEEALAVAHRLAARALRDSEAYAGMPAGTRDEIDLLLT